MTSQASPTDRIVITGIGLTSPNGNTLAEYRDALLGGRSGVRDYEIRYVGKTLAGVCDFDELKYQKRKEVRRGTRAGGVSIYCSNEALQDSGYRVTTESPYLDRHVRAALERHMAEVLLGSLEINPEPTEAELEARAGAAQVSLIEQVGGAAVLAAAREAEGLDVAISIEPSAGSISPGVIVIAVMESDCGRSPAWCRRGRWPPPALRAASRGCRP